MDLQIQLLVESAGNCLFAVCNCVLQMQEISETIYKGKSNARDYWLMDGQKITTWR